MPAPMPLKQNHREEVQSEASGESQDEADQEEVSSKPKQFSVEELYKPTVYLGETIVTSSRFHSQLLDLENNNVKR